MDPNAVQEDISRFVARLIADAARNAVIKDNAAPPTQQQKGGTSWAVHVIMEIFADCMRRRDILLHKHYIADFCSVLKVSMSDIASSWPTLPTWAPTPWHD